MGSYIEINEKPVLKDKILIIFHSLTENQYLWSSITVQNFIWNDF